MNKISVVLTLLNNNEVLKETQSMILQPPGHFILNSKVKKGVYDTSSYMTGTNVVFDSDRNLR